MIARTLVRISWGGLEKIILYSSSVAFTVPTVVAGIGIIKMWGGNGLLSNFMNAVFGDMFFNLYGLFVDLHMLYCLQFDMFLMYCE